VLIVKLNLLKNFIWINFAVGVHRLLLYHLVDVVEVFARHSLAGLVPKIISLIACTRSGISIVAV